MVRVHPLLFQNLANFVRTTLPVSFGRDTVSCWSLLPGVCAGEVKDPIQGSEKKTCYGLKSAS